MTDLWQPCPHSECQGRIGPEDRWVSPGETRYRQGRWQVARIIYIVCPVCRRAWRGELGEDDQPLALAELVFREDRALARSIVGRQSDQTPSGPMRPEQVIGVI